MSKKQQLAFAEELISKLRNKDLYIVNKNDCGVCIQDVKSIINSPRTWILSVSEILESEEALKCLFSWGINDALHSEDQELVREGGNNTNEVETVSIGTSTVKFSSPDGSSFSANEITIFPDSYF